MLITYSFLPVGNKYYHYNSCREDSKVSLLEGMGSRYCVVPHPIWKYLGDEHDDEPMTRKKCIAFILGIILVLLLIAIVLGLIIGLGMFILFFYCI